jgi:hypothetical protein
VLDEPSRWDPFALGELTVIAEAMEAAYFEIGQLDLPLWLDLLEAMDARRAGTEQLRHELRRSAEEARWATWTGSKAEDRGEIR